MKTDTTHTQGPWKVLEHGKGIGKHCVGTENTAPVQAVICEINTKSLLTTDAIRLANARLIAACPELLAALRECITDEGAHCLAYGSDTPTLRRRIAAINELARAAIRKAEGNK
jgi:hypothetical protein